MNRNGLRKPKAMTRALFASLLPAFALSGQAAPVSGSMRRSAPSSEAGSLSVRVSCERSAPPAWFGSPHGLTGVTGDVLFGSVPPSWP